jgi:quercetin dioxygenase-like cupin family protein
MFTLAPSTLHRSRILLLGAIVAAVTATPASAQAARQSSSATKSHAAIQGSKSAKLTWAKAPNFLPAGAMMAVVSGDPSKPGPFTVELSFPNGYRIPPHSHPTAEHVAVKSGEFMYGMGDAIKAADLKAMKPGDSGDIPAGMHHYAEARGKTRIELSSTGPFVINYVHPRDDPRTKAR